MTDSDKLENRKLERRAKEWLRTEHSEGNVQSLVNLIKEFTESRGRAILKGDIRMTKKELLKENQLLRIYGDLACHQELYIAELKSQIEKMKCCQNCDNWNWKHNKCEKKLKGDCFKASKWQLRR